MTDQAKTPAPGEPTPVAPETDDTDEPTVITITEPTLIVPDDSQEEQP